MSRFLAALIIGILLAFTPTAVLAQEKDDDDFLLRIGGNVTIPAGETIGTLVVIDGDAVIDGTVKDAVVVISGDLTVNGRVEGDITVVRGDLDLRSGSSVEDVHLIRSDIQRASDAQVQGEITERDTFRFAEGFFALFSIIFWAAITVAVIVSGLVFAAVGGRQLVATAHTMTGDAVNTILGFVFVWVALPLLAVLAIVTLIGLPLGLGIFIFLLPVLWFLGYLVAGTRLGLAIVARNQPAPEHPYLAAFVGLLILQLIVLIPILGAIVALFAGAWGAGALAYTAFRAAGGRGFTSAPPSPPEAPAAPAA